MLIALVESKNGAEWTKPLIAARAHEKTDWENDPTMLGYRALLNLPIAFLLLTAPWSNATALAADKDAKKEGKVAGILIEKNGDYISVKADGDEEPVKYLTGGASNKALAESLKSLFSVSRVQLTYKTEGESRKLVSIKRHVPKAKGTVTGKVVKNHGWWIEVKPKTGVPDGFACDYPFDKNKEMMHKLKDLNEGDSVTITYTTDFERHRIQSLRKNPSKPSNTASSSSSAAPRDAIKHP
ncbi:MAG: hypothetical protein ACREHD_23070 [Pirellulales bacterium]